MLHSSRCAACKSLRRRCPQDCVLAPYFPGNNPQRFACVHKIFGASNVTRMLQQLPVHDRSAAAECMAFEAASRVQDPVYGCVGFVYQLQQQISMVERELAKTQGEITLYTTQQAHQQEQKMTVAHVDLGEPSFFHASQQELFHLDQHLILPGFSHLND